jgi:hypothetical protein
LSPRAHLARLPRAFPRLHVIVVTI